MLIYTDISIPRETFSLSLSLELAQVYFVTLLQYKPREHVRFEYT